MVLLKDFFFKKKSLFEKIRYKNQQSIKTCEITQHIISFTIFSSFSSSSDIQITNCLTKKCNAVHEVENPGSRPWVDTEKGTRGPDPPEKSQKYRVSYHPLKITKKQS